MKFVTSTLSSSILSLNAVAMGEKKADMIFKNCKLVNVYTREIIPQTQIAILNDRIAFVGPDATHTTGPKTTVIDLEEKFVSPGFADPHIHIDQFVLPSEMIKKSLLCGVTSFFSDPIDIVSVCGYRGFLEFLRQTTDLPLRIFHVVPGGLPVDTNCQPLETNLAPLARFSSAGMARRFEIAQHCLKRRSPTSLIGNKLRGRIWSI